MLVSGNSHTNVTEIYNEATGQWVQTGNVNQERDSTTPILLDNGKVLIAGGSTLGGGALSSSELYDPATGQWTYTGSMNGPRVLPVFVKLLDGRVIAISGSRDTHESATTTCEIYDPATGQWSPTGDVIQPLFGGNYEDAVLLNDGRVLLVGSVSFTSSVLAELYDPVTGTWSQTGDLLVPRQNTRLVTLPDGRVLMAGGGAGNSLADSELYDPATGQWSSTGSLNYARLGHGAKLLPDGKVLVAGGLDFSNGNLVSSELPAELYDPVTGAWTVDALPITAHNNAGLVVLPDGKVLFVGGDNYPNGPTRDAELFTEDVSQLTALAPAQVWVGLKNSDDVGVKFDLQVVAYANGVPVGSGMLASFGGGSSGFNNAHLATVPFESFAPVSFDPGSVLSITISVRNACIGSGHNSGTARLWYNDAAANSQFGATIGAMSSPFFLRTASILATATGTGPKATSDVQSGAKCSAFKPFGTWQKTL
jgi:hypothetical protein